ncbi:hypothetical protein [uncultured Roseibium sp.]|uniref:hypothetical protein n=1 Tax=uncultured Roseibium sp. TaxID=1936171 RepID=UPI0026354FFF|nr:hypothetical protein [uncultured Roseibium sp.]
MNTSNTLPTPACTYLKFIDTEYLMPGTASAFIRFEPPVFDGTSITFLGDNEEREGLFVLRYNGVLERITDNATPLPGLYGPPTGAGQTDAYVQSFSNSPLDPSGTLNPCDTLTIPRPVFVDGFVAFFAANWPQRRAGIFLYDRSSGTVRPKPLVSNSEGAFLRGAFGQPVAGASGSVYFPGFGGPQNDHSGTKMDPGIYSVSVYDHEQKITQILNTVTASTPERNMLQSIGNPNVWPRLPEDELLFFGLNLDENEAIFGCNIDGLHTKVGPGYQFSDGTISGVSDTFSSQISVGRNGGLLAFKTELTISGGGAAGAVIALSFDTHPAQPELILTAVSPVPGVTGPNVMFTGNSFATPPATDGKRVAFCAGYMDDNTTNGVGLFVWNSGAATTKLALKAGDFMDMKEVTNIHIGTDCFVDGILVAKVNFHDGSEGLYRLDLSNF